MKILVYVQQEDGKENPVSLEALRAAQEIADKLGGTVHAVAFNQSAGESLIGFDLAEILFAEDPNLNPYNPLYYIKAMQQVVLSESPDLIIFGHSYEVRDWVPRLSARLNKPFISDCTGFNADSQLILIRSIYQGKFNANLSVNDSSYLISFQAGSFSADDLNSGSASLREISLNLADVNDTIRPGEKFQETEKSVDLSQAEVIVSVGRGIGKKENLQMVYDLSKAIGGEVASSRPIVDSGWLEPYHQIGSSGQTVAPKLYLALGISGAIQHVVGMKSSKNIVVINKDANAPLFEIADYGVIGDIFEIIPKLTTAIQNT